jgi:hypothetical protein
MTYRDGDPRFEIIRPEDTMPTAYRGPAEGNDFAWVKPTWLDRLRGRSMVKSLVVLNDGLRLATEYNQQAAVYEQSRQAIIHARNQEQLLPLKLEQERSEYELVLVRSQCAIQDELERRKRVHLEHKRAIIEQKGARQTAKARIKQNKRARRAAREADRRRPFAETPPPAQFVDDGPEAFQRHFKTMQEAKRNLSEGERRIRAIYARAAAERRQLTEEELLEVDAIADAAQAAEDEVRRSGASDLGR